MPPAPITMTPAPGPAAPQPEFLGTATRFIRVTGYGVVRVKPGEAHIVFLVSTTASSALAALRQNADQVVKVAKGLEAAGVAHDNIVTSESSLVTMLPTSAGFQTGGVATGPNDTPIDTGVGPASPDAPQGGGSGVPSRYTANARVQVLTREVADASAIVQIGMYAGASGVLGMTFEPRNIADLKQQALIVALKDAANKAEILSLGVKVRILYAISVSELPATAPDQPGSSIAPPAEVAVPMNIEVVYAIG